jgi:glycosyltransferase involved in cell wall biosynthesis
VLIEAWRKADLGSRAELWLVGSGKFPESARAVEGVRYFGHVQRAKLAELMRRAHVFVFPSFFEGLAQVQVEALASGLPVIGTDESGASDVVAEGETGFIVPAGSVDHLEHCLARLAGDSAALTALRERCIEARDRRSWHDYGNKWLSLLAHISKY